MSDCPLFSCFPKYCSASIKENILIPIPTSYRQHWQPNPHHRIPALILTIHNPIVERASNVTKNAKYCMPMCKCWCTIVLDETSDCSLIFPDVVEGCSKWLPRGVPTPPFVPNGYLQHVQRVVFLHMFGSCHCIVVGPDLCYP